MNLQSCIGQQKFEWVVLIITALNGTPTKPLIIINEQFIKKKKGTPLSDSIIRQFLAQFERDEQLEKNFNTCVAESRKARASGSLTFWTADSYPKIM